jgi:hypothetical protein
MPCWRSFFLGRRREESIRFGLVQVSDMAKRGLEREYWERVQRAFLNGKSPSVAVGRPGRRWEIIVLYIGDRLSSSRIFSRDTIDDERRLLYVSLTHAKHHLFVTYCDRRTGSQRRTECNTEKSNRSLTQFLMDCTRPPQDGRASIRSLAQEDE